MGCHLRRCPVEERFVSNHRDVFFAASYEKDLYMATNVGGDPKYLSHYLDSLHSVITAHSSLLIPNSSFFTPHSSLLTTLTAHHSQLTTLHSLLTPLHSPITTLHSLLTTHYPPRLLTFPRWSIPERSFHNCCNNSSSKPNVRIESTYVHQ